MDDDRRIQPVRLGLNRLERRRLERVRSVRCGGRNDQRIVLPLGNELFGVGECRLWRFIVRDRKSDDRLAQHPAHAGLFGLVGDRVFKVIHVAVRRRPATDHLGHPETRAGPDKLFVNVLGLGRKDEFCKPVVKVQVVRNAAKQRHRSVRVGIDQPRDDGLAGRVDGAFGSQIFGHHGPRPDL